MIFYKNICNSASALTNLKKSNFSLFFLLPRTYINVPIYHNVQEFELFQIFVVFESVKGNVTLFSLFKESNRRRNPRESSIFRSSVICNRSWFTSKANLPGNYLCKIFAWENWSNHWEADTATLQTTTVSSQISSDEKWIVSIHNEATDF